MADEVRAGIKFHPKDKYLQLEEAVPRETSGLVLRDNEGVEHFFGSVEPIASDALGFQYVTSYGDGGQDRRWPSGVHDTLRDGHTLVELTKGPSLSPRARFAIADLARDSALKGLAFDFERTMAVRTLLALQQAGEALPPEEVEVCGAMNGLSLKQAAKLREMTERVLSGGRFQPAIRLDDEQYERFLRYWDEHLDSSAS